MHPVLFSIGATEIRASYVFLALGLLAGGLFGGRQARRMGYDPKRTRQFLLAAIPFGLLLAAVNGALFWLGWDSLLENLAHGATGGVVAFGAVLGALFMGWLFARRNGAPSGPVLDLVSLTLPLILAIYRIGCLLNGCCYGLETDGPLGMVLPGGGGVWAARYPTQIMLMVFDLALFAWLWRRRETRPLDGSLTIAFLIAYSLGRLGIDALRDLPRVWGPFSLHQLASIAILAVTAYVAFELRLERRAAA
jgi:phosphatidylglycerol---prolipoprotein diacylglyceryl transferase